MPPPATVPPPDPAAEPAGFVVVLDHDRIHFLDWGGPGVGRPEHAARPGVGRPEQPAGPGALLVHGLGGTAWAWTPVARRLRAVVPVVAMDLRGHGLSDAPTSGYELSRLAEDAIAVAEGAGLLVAAAGGDPDPRADADRRAGGDSHGNGSIVLAGHGFGAMVAAWAAAELGPRCAGLVLVDGGWEDLHDAAGMEPDEWLRGLDEPPEIMASMDAFLADRAGFDPATWDADQERAARATVVEVPAGHLVPSIHPHALARSVEAMFAFRPSEVLPRVGVPIRALVAADDEKGTRIDALARTQAALVAAGRPPIAVQTFPGLGHNLMRYRPVEVAAAILAASAARSGPAGG